MSYVKNGLDGRFLPVKAALAGAGEAQGVPRYRTARLALDLLVQRVEAGGADVQHPAAFGADEVLSLIHI